MSEHQSACLQLLTQRSILIKEYRMYNNIHNEVPKGDERYWSSSRMMSCIRKDISRMTKIIKGK